MFFLNQTFLWHQIKIFLYEKSVNFIQILSKFILETKITKILGGGVFSRETRLKSIQFIHTIHELWTFAWPFCNWQHVVTVQTLKYNTCTTNFPIIISFNPRTAHQPRHPNRCKSGPTWHIPSPLRTSLHFF